MLINADIVEKTWRFDNRRNLLAFITSTVAVGYSSDSVRRRSGLEPLVISQLKHLRQHSLVNILR